MHGRMLLCPWCGTWNHLEDYIALQLPPNYHNQIAPIFKHGGEGGCKKLFAPIIEI